MIRHPGARVGVFIDTQNMYYSARSLFDRKVNFGNIVQKAIGENGQLVRAFAYVVSTKEGEESPFFEALQKLGIELRVKKLMEYFSGQKKADWDVGLTVDAIRLIDMVDVIVIVSGDGDFIPLIKYIQSRGRIVEVMAFRETTSSRLLEEVDAYTNMSDEKQTYLIGPPIRPTKQKPSSQKSDAKTPSSKKGAQTTLSTEEEMQQDISSTISFFEAMPDDIDPEEKRRNRLSF